MTRTLYIYDGPPAEAVQHLLKMSSLRAVTQIDTYYSADGDFTRVNLHHADITEAQHELWTAAQAIGQEVGFVDITAAARQLNAVDKAALVKAVSIALGEEEGAA